MEMFNPCHPGDIVKDCLEELDVSVANAAKTMGISRQQLYKIITCNSKITADMAIRLEKTIGSTATTWLTMQTNYDLSKARKKANYRLKNLHNMQTDYQFA